MHGYFQRKLQNDANIDKILLVLYQGNWTQ